MLGGCTHIKVEENSGDEEQPEPRRPKKKVVERKGKGTPAASAGNFLDTDPLVDKLANVVSHAADEACKQAVTGVMKRKGIEAKLTRAEADNKILPDKIG